MDLRKTHKSEARRDKHTHKYCYVVRQQDPVSGRGPLPLALNVGGRKVGVGNEGEEEGGEGR